MSGLAFNNLYKGTKFYKFLFDNLVHRGFQYNLGTNIDDHEFNPKYECSEGGLYFCDQTKCHMFWKNYGHTLGVVEIPNDARVYIEKDKFKADKIILSEVLNFKRVPVIFWIDMLQYDGTALEYILAENQTEDVCKMAVRQNGLALQYVRIEQTELMCMIAVQQNNYALKFVKNKTPAVCLVAVRENGNALRMCDGKAQTDEVCKAAVMKDGHALRHVISQTDEICMLAVQQSGLALFYVKFQTYELCRAAVQEDGLALKYVEKQTNELCALAVSNDGMALQYVKKQTPEIKRLALKQNVAARAFLK